MVGFDIGGTKCAVCIGEEIGGELKIYDKKEFKTDFSLTPYKIIDRMYVLAKSMTTNVDLIGISCGGPLNSKNGVIMSPPNLPGWDNVKVTEYIKEKYNTTAFIENDANACALAEWKYGAGKGCNNMVFITFGTGLGAGLILNGNLYRGVSDMAGEIGHIRLKKTGPVGYGKSGSFEGFCSGGGIALLGKIYAVDKIKSGQKVSFCQDMSAIDGITAKSIARYAKLGNEDAANIYKQSARMLGYGLSIIIDILNPEKIVIGSVFQRSEELFRYEMEKVLKEECLSYSLDKCRIVPAKLGDNIGDYASLSVADMHRKETYL